MANRDLNKLTPEFKKRVEKFLKEVWDKIFITEWYRSQARQNELYKQGRSLPWNIVTWTTKSYHTTWAAIDIAFKWAKLYPEDFNKWRAIWDVARKYWIEWWYDLWKTDKPHFQMMDNFDSKAENAQSRKIAQLDNEKMNNFNTNDNYMDARIERYKTEWYNPIFDKHDTEEKVMIEIAMKRFMDRFPKPIAKYLYGKGK